MTITKDLIEQFKQWVFSHSSEDTAVSYAYKVSQYCLGMSVIEMNTPQFFSKTVLNLKSRDLGLSTIGNYVASFKKFLRFMEIFHSLELINLDVIKCQRPQKREVAFLEKEEVQKIRDVSRENLSDLLDHALFEFYLHTGCRVSEGVSLDWENIDFEKGEVEVIGKGTKPRIVFMGEAVYWIRKYLEARKDSSRPLFVNQYGGRLRRCNVHLRIRKLGRKANLGRSIHPHILRATYCTYLILGGTDPKTVQQLMGHEDLETTLRYYFAVTRNHMKEAHLSLEKYLKSPVGC